MSHRFYFDESAQGGIAEGLRRRGIDVLTVEDDGLRAAPDVRVLERAAELGRVVFSQDTDFLREAVARLRSGAGFATVVYAHPVHVPIGRCVDDLELFARVAADDEARNQIFYLPLH